MYLPAPPECVPAQHKWSHSGGCCFLHSSWECTQRASHALAGCGWRLPEWCGEKKSHLFLYVICSDICFIPEVPGCPLLAWGLSPLHVPDGTSSQNTEIQLPDRSTGLRGCPSREDPSGVPQTASVLHLASLFQQLGNGSERADALKSHCCLGKGYSGNSCESRMGYYPICPLSVMALIHFSLLPSA